jgi:hypothetical protein
MHVADGCRYVDRDGATKMAIAAETDDQIRAAMTGRPTSTQAPTARVSMALALRSAYQSASRITWSIVSVVDGCRTSADP